MSSSRAEATSRRQHQRVQEAQAAASLAKAVRRGRRPRDWTDYWLPSVAGSAQPYAVRQQVATWVQAQVEGVRTYLASYTPLQPVDATLPVILETQEGGGQPRLLFADGGEGLTLRGQRFTLHGLDCFVPATRGTLEPTVITRPSDLNAQGAPVVLPTWFLDKVQSFHRDLANHLDLLDALMLEKKPFAYDKAQTALALALLATRELWWLPTQAGGTFIAQATRATLSSSGWEFRMQPTSFVAAQVLCADRPEEYTLYPLDNTTGTYNLTTYFQYETAAISPLRYPYRGLDTNLNERMFTLTGCDQYGSRNMGTYIWPRSATVVDSYTYPLAYPIVTSTSTVAGGNIIVGTTPPANPAPGDFWIKA